MQARDAEGNDKVTGGDVFEVAVTGGTDEAHTVSPAYVGSGRYEVSYTAMQAGAYTIDVTMGGSHIYCGFGAAEKCSPFAVVVEPGPTSHETTVATGPGLSSAVAGVVSAFNIQARDTYGNDRLEGGDASSIEVVLTHAVSGAAFVAVVADGGDGTYGVTYTVLEAGEYAVSATYNGLAFLTKGDGTFDPATVQCAHWDLHGLSSVADGAGLHAAVSGAESLPTQSPTCETSPRCSRPISATSPTTSAYLSKYGLRAESDSQPHVSHFVADCWISQAGSRCMPGTRSRTAATARGAPATARTTRSW